MPTWLQGTIAVLAAGVTAWIGWATMMISKHDRAIGEINERCHGRESWIKSIAEIQDKITTKIDKIDRNVVRLGMKSGLDKGELEYEGD